MTNKSTKRALLSSVMALFLCFAMLLGTTFAWFTDSVESDVNKIVAGNLDVELEYATVTNGTVSAWNKVAGAKNIFDSDARWEPGRVEVVYLKVSNLGNLDLKYQLGVNVDADNPGTNVNDEEFYLSDYLVFKTVLLNDATEIGTFTRDNAVNANDAIGFKDYNGKTTALESGKFDYVALIVYMPTTVGNKANFKTGTTPPSIEFGVKLYATQQGAEEDSFGPDYDDGANHEKFKVTTGLDLQNAVNEANPGDTITIENDIVLDGAITIPASSTTFSLRSTPAPIKINLNGKTVNNPNGYAIENQGNIVITGNGTISGLGCIRSKAGSITIENGNFYASSRWQDGVYQHTLKAENTVVVIKGGNFDATVNGQTNAMFNASTDATITIDGGSFKNVAGDLAQFDPYIFTYEKNGAVVINGGTFYGGWRFNGETATTVINGGTFSVGFDGQSFHAQSTHEVTVYGGTFTAGTKLADKLDSILAGGFKAASTPDGYLVIPADSNYVANGVLVSTDEKTYYISNVEGYAWVDAQTDSFFLNKTIAFTADIDFGGKTLTTIRFWNGKVVVDGQGHTLSNFVIGYSGSKKPSGLFSGTFDVKNLNVDKADVTGDYVGVISGQMYGNIDNCVVTNSVINGTYWQTGALAGQYNAGNVTNCVVDGCTINGMSAVGGLIGILNETAGVRTIEGCTVTNTTIVQTGSFGDSYDRYFGIAVGLINIKNSTVNFTDCTFTNNTLKGVASKTVYGEAESSTVVYIDGAKAVSTAEELQAALDANTEKIIFVADITGYVTAPQAPGVKYTIDGNGKTFVGAITVDGKSKAYPTAGLTIKNVNFVADSITTEACINLGVKGNDNTRYINNLTVENCTFDVPGAVAIKSHDNGDKNLTVIGCTVSARAHSLVQVNNVGDNGLLVENCKVYSKNGVNIGQSEKVTVKGCEFNVKGYAVRFGANGSANGIAETYVIENCQLKSECAESGDAVVILRVTADKATLTITNSTLVGPTEILNNSNADVVNN